VHSLTTILTCQGRVGGGASYLPGPRKGQEGGLEDALPVIARISRIRCRPVSHLAHTATSAASLCPRTTTQTSMVAAT